MGIYFNNPNNIDVTDCTSDEFYNFFRERSRINTETYDEVFKCMPSDNILNFNDLVRYAEWAERACLSKQNPFEVNQLFNYYRIIFT